MKVGFPEARGRGCGRGRESRRRIAPNGGAEAFVGAVVDCAGYLRRRGIRRAGATAGATGLETGEC